MTRYAPKARHKYIVYLIHSLPLWLCCDQLRDKDVGTAPRSGYTQFDALSAV